MLPQYNVGDAEAYAKGQGWAYKTSGSHLILQSCPWCSKAFKLYWNNESGAYDCKVCGKAGNYFTFRRDLGDPVPIDKPMTALALQKEKPKKKRKTFAEYASFEKALLGSEKGMAYLASRGISRESAIKWKLGLKSEPPEVHKIRVKDKNGDEQLYAEPVDWLMIPYLSKQGDIADVKYRTIDPAPKRFKRLGGESILYGEHLLPEAKGKRKATVDALYLCEGELDAITLDQHGFSPALSTTTGAGSFSPRSYDLIAGCGAKRIYLVYDSDVDGQAGAQKLAKKFADTDREVINLVLEDAKDSNEFFRTHTADDFRQLIKDARPVELEFCLSMIAVVDRLEEQLFMSGGQLNGFASVHKNINDLIDGGYWKGNLITVVGGSGTGKTTLILQDLIHIAERHGPTWMCCLEMPPEMMLRKVINHRYHIPIGDVKQAHIEKYREHLEQLPLYFGGHKIRNIDQAAEYFIKAHKRYDIKALCFDNIHFLCRDPRNQTAELSHATKTLKELAIELNMPVIAIGQPGKFDRAERIINENDVRGSAAIEQDSDYLLLMWRPTLRTEIETFGQNMGVKENMSPLTYVRCGKARYSPGGETLLYFHGDIGTFRALTPQEQTALVQEAQNQPKEEKVRRGRSYK
jgi:replicative DNA helicase